MKENKENLSVISSIMLRKLRFTQKSLFENSMSLSDRQRILWNAVEKFCNLLMLLNLNFYIALGTLFI